MTTSPDASVVLRSVLTIALAYLIGGIPWALIIGKRFYHVDLRKVGSGNLGATNVFRILGTDAGVAVAVLDVAKGAFAVVLAGLLVPSTPYAALHEWVLVGATAAAMLGHSYSPYIRFSGGKGVAVAAGALLVLMPLVWPPLLLLFVVVIAITRYVSLGSICAAAAFPLVVLWLYPTLPTIVFAFAGAVLVIWRHRSNIGRIRRGEESKIDFRNATQRAHEAAEQAREHARNRRDGT